MLSNAQQSTFAVSFDSKGAIKDGIIYTFCMDLTKIRLFPFILPHHRAQTEMRRESGETPRSRV